ncbi:MAG: polyhydroxyalkanoate synthesis repressor PhaR [Hyphomicrobiales bacterium]|nr:polyhydroxyalkanoate synthesis repressor PhaR [Hyphomicrobiales bacterium]
MTIKSAALAAGLDKEHRDMIRADNKKRDQVIIKKYANRRLYNTETSAYVTLEDLAEMVRSERDFVVFDAKTSEDLTHAVLTQIIVDEEGKDGQSLLPIGFLRQLIRFYGHSIERLVPSYLEFSLNTLTKDQDKYNQHFAGLFGTAALEAMHEQTLNNIAMFEKTLAMFSPFAVQTSGKRQISAPESTKNIDATPTVKSDDIAELKSQLAAMQAQIDRLSKPSE